MEQLTFAAETISMCGKRRSKKLVRCGAEKRKDPRAGKHVRVDEVEVPVARRG